LQTLIKIVLFQLAITSNTFISYIMFIAYKTRKKYILFNYKHMNRKFNKPRPRPINGYDDYHYYWPQCHDYPWWYYHNYLDYDWYDYGYDWYDHGYDWYDHGYDWYDHGYDWDDNGHDWDDNGHDWDDNGHDWDDNGHDWDDNGHSKKPKMKMPNRPRHIPTRLRQPLRPRPRAIPKSLPHLRPRPRSLPHLKPRPKKFRMPNPIQKSQRS